MPANTLRILAFLLIATLGIQPAKAQTWLQPGCEMPTARELADYLSHQSGDILNKDVIESIFAVASTPAPVKGVRAGLVFSELWCKCSGSPDPWGCLGANMDRTTICELWDISGFPDVSNPFGVISSGSPAVGVPLATIYEVETGSGDICDASPRRPDANLVCCRYNPERPCHSGSAPNAGNCLGAPSPPFNPEYFGPVAYTRFGPTCDHYPECSDGESGGDDSITLERWRLWMFALAEEYGRRVLAPPGRQRTRCNLDLVTFLGCKDYDKVMAQGEPYRQMIAFADDAANAETGTINTHLLLTAAHRVMFAIPRGLERYDYIESRLWTPADRARHMAGVPNPTAELRNWLSECGLELLQATMPQHWELMAAPSPGEKPSGRRAGQGWVDGCLAGTPPQSLTATASRNGQVVSVDVTVVDPDTPAGGQAERAITIRWGDGDIEGVVYRHGAGNSYSHTYTGEVAPSLRLVYVNGSGHVLQSGASIPAP